MNEKDKMTQEIIHYHKGIDYTNPLVKWGMIIYGAFIGILCGFFATIILTVIVSIFISDPLDSLFFVLIPPGLYLYYKLILKELKSKYSFKIFEDRIEFFSEVTPLEKDIILIEEIDQVRYEDDFGKYYNSNVPNQPFIFCYFKNGYKSQSKKIKKDRLKLFLKEGSKKENDIIKILQFFQKKKKQVYISTRSHKIRTALNLKNWTDPGFNIPISF